VVLPDSHRGLRLEGHRVQGSAPTLEGHRGTHKSGTRMLRMLRYLATVHAEADKERERET
jgi:hypothetical protein